MDINTDLSSVDFGFFLKQKTVCPWIKLKRESQSVPGSSHEPFWKIKIVYSFFYKIRYCYPCQVDPECSGWFNTIAAFFVGFLYFLLFSPYFYFSLSLHMMYNNTDTSFCNTPSKLNILSFLKHSDVIHARTHTQPIFRQL